MTQNRSWSLARCVAFVAATLIAASAQPAASQPISISGIRPLAKAAEILEMRYGIPISFEDISTYAYSGDLEDPGERDPNAITVLPKKGTLNFLAEPLDINYLDPTPEQKGRVISFLQYVIDQHAANGKRFKIIETPLGLAIAPTAVRDSQGTFVPDQSPLDLRISLSGDDAGSIFQAFGKALSAACGKPVTVDNFGLLRTLTTPIQANNEVARDLLVKILRSLDPSPIATRAIGDEGLLRTLITWVLSTDPGIDASHPTTYRLHLKRMSIDRDSKGHFQITTAF